ncbi:MAG: DUF3885 domain-containing protein [Zoogloeaceae bacterium]|jgi:hypothetical protein|nr:DUF3885 domain-containing protein [Zoogloeaceae bacterium]
MINTFIPRSPHDAVTNVVYRIGMARLERPVFYLCPVALRFDIGGRWDLALKILHAMPGKPDLLLWRTYPDDKPKPDDGLLDKFCAICGIPDPDETTMVSHDDECSGHTLDHCWRLKDQRLDAKALFGEIARAELGGFTEFAGTVFLFDTVHDTLFFFYDDRGLDVAARSVDTLSPLYKQFDQHILAYDRARIDGIFLPNIRT